MPLNVCRIGFSDLILLWSSTDSTDGEKRAKRAGPYLYLGNADRHFNHWLIL
jgi:hypothetical protein